jgi:hypothetical protein
MLEGLPEQVPHVEVVKVDSCDAPFLTLGRIETESQGEHNPKIEVRACRLPSGARFIARWSPTKSATPLNVCFSVGSSS